MLTFARSIVESLHYPLLVLNARDEVIAANTAFYHDFDISPADFQGRPFFELSDGLWDIPQLRSLLREAAVNDKGFEGFEICLDIPNLGKRAMVLSGSKIKRDNDEATFVVLAIEDAPLLRRNAKTHQRHYADLEELIAERTEELKATNRELQHTVQELATVNRELEAFCYSVSHDLRTPLRAVDGFSQQLLQSHSNQLDDQGQHYLRRIRVGTQRMGQLIDDLLTLSRVTRVEMNKEEVDLTSLAETVMAELQQLEPGRTISFTNHPGLSATCDSRAARIILQNLLGNAWKFTSKKLEAVIEFDQLEVNGKRAFVVRDNGAGFDPAFGHKLFNAFQRLHSDREFPGTGIGLATVQRIMRRHGGEAWAEGVVDQGASIYFSFPDTGHIS